MDLLTEEAAMFERGEVPKYFKISYKECRTQIPPQYIKGWCSQTAPWDAWVGAKVKGDVYCIVKLLRGVLKVFGAEIDKVVTNWMWLCW